MRTSASLDALDLVHGFGDRTVGTSEGIYAHGNAGLRSGDDPDAVRANRRLFAAALGVDASALCTARQVHGTDVLVVEAGEEGQRDADAVVSATPGLLVAVTTADCVPVLLADPEARVVAAAHAGWRGAVAGILAATVARMVERGARADRVVAAIGPAIRQPSYEVDPPFKTAVLDAHAWAMPLFAAGRVSDRWQFDLPGLTKRLLYSAGIKHVDDLGVDTLEESLRYFSHRRSRQLNEVGYGVQLSGIVVPL